MVTVTTPCFKRSAFTSGIPNDLLIQLDELLPRCMYFQWKKHVRTLHGSNPQTSVVSMAFLFCLTLWESTHSTHLGFFDVHFNGENK
jgi:hypothetical protein